MCTSQCFRQVTMCKDESYAKSILIHQKAKLKKADNLNLKSGPPTYNNKQVVKYLVGLILSIKYASGIQN